MKKPQLTESERETYMRIVKFGTMDDMFEFANAIGRERLAKEQMELLKGI